MKRLCLLIALIFGMNVIAQNTNEIPKKYQSLLWEISGNGLKKPSYLYGTMHVSNKLAFHLSDSVFEAIKSVDMVALEIDFSIWMKEVINTRNARENMEYIEDYNMRGGIYKRAIKPNIPEKEVLESSLSSYPRIINHMLYRNNSSSNDFQEDTYLDLYIYQVGKKLNKKIGGLEDYLVSEEMANKAFMPDARNKQTEADNSLKEVRLKELTKDRNSYRLYEDLYRSGNLDLLDTISKLSHSKNYIKYLLIERNVIMAKSMDSLMKTQGLFAAVGCAHLPGDSGVIELLRDMGYTVKPLRYMSVDGIDPVIKTQIEDIRYPVDFQPQTSSDSVFSVSVPGKLYEYMNDVDGSKMYITNDLANGGYYYIQRLNHFGGLISKDDKYIKERIDSLLYENIPGEIKKKTEIVSNNGYLGYDIVNKTNKGDWQRYNIFISPHEIFIFKFGGTGEYLNKGNEVNAFFNSIKFNLQTGDKQTTYKSESGGYSIKIPSNYLNYKSKDPREIQRELITASNDKAKEYFYLSLSSIYDYNYIEEDTFELNLLSEVYANELKYKIANRKHGSFGKYPSLEASLKKDNDSINIKIIIRGNNYYLMACKSPNPQTSTDFFNSLNFSEISYTRPFEQYTDTAMHFSVKTQFEDTPYNHLAKKDMELNNHSYSRYYVEEKPSDFLPVNKSRFFVSNETGEKIMVKYTKYSMFYQEKSKDEFWKNKVDDMTKTNGMIVRKKTINDKPGQSEMNLVLTDTNSSRGILVKIIQKCGTLYTLKTSFDTIEGPTRFTKTFFESFQPQDTCIGIDILTDKITDHFFNKIYSKDSVAREKAIAASDYVIRNFNDKHVENLISTIESNEFSKLNLSLKTDLIRSIGNLKSDKILPFLEKIYYRYSDSLTIQSAILTAVSRQESEKAPEYFIRMLKAELPVSTKNSDLSFLFAGFSDSLEIASKLFPKILMFTKYPGYKEPIYSLMSSCIKEGTLKSKVYKSRKDDILRDAFYDLRVLMSENEGDDENYYNYSYERDVAVSYTFSDYNLNDNEQDIYNYSIILNPFYRDKKVKAYVDKVFQNKSDKLNILIAAYYQKKGTTINDTLWDYYSRNMKTRTDAFKVLSEIKSLDKFNNKYLNQKDLVLSLTYGNNENLKNDSIVYLDRKLVMTKKDTGYIYIFKSCPKDKKVWKLAFSGIHPLDDRKISYNININKYNILFENEKQIKNEMDKISNKVRIMNRKRASVSDLSNSRGRYESYYYDNDDN